ncbi:MAG TPA: hypothetical protein VMF08_09460 [Candidatus Sulfotelmatobacter sp.]|nr:hypothetical protein [Candidatus Sulfotelmatobacter sp.]
MNNNSALIPDDSLMPSLIQIAGRPEDPSVVRPALVNRSSLAEMTLNPKRLEAILNAIMKKKKSASR